MFVFSKLFWLIAQPLSLGFFLTLFGLLVGGLGFKWLRTISLAIALIIEFLALFTTTGAVAIGVLEARFSRADLPAQTPECAIVLGGGFDGTVTKIRGNIEFGAAGDRFIEGLRLARLYPDMKLVITGGDPTLDHSSEGDADIAERFYTEMGLDPTRTILENQSRNTEENAAFTAPILKVHNLSSCLLVTSAFHMPRSVGLFRKVGVEITPWPVDYKTTGQEKLAFDFFELSNNAMLLETALHEYVGLLASFLTGKSDSLIPKQYHSL